MSHLTNGASTHVRLNLTYTDLPRPKLDDATRAAAIAAVNEAMAAFEKQAWYLTVWANVRFGLFWATYKLRLILAVFLVTKLGLNDHKVWRRLGL